MLVTDKTTLSHVMQYGSKSIKKLDLDYFQGGETANPSTPISMFLEDAVPQQDVSSTQKKV